MLDCRLWTVGLKSALVQALLSEKDYPCLNCVKETTYIARTAMNDKQSRIGIGGKEMQM